MYRQQPEDADLVYAVLQHLSRTSDGGKEFAEERKILIMPTGCQTLFGNFKIDVMIQEIVHGTEIKKPY